MPTFQWKDHIEIHGCLVCFTRLGQFVKVSTYTKQINRILSSLYISLYIFFHISSYISIYNSLVQLPPKPTLEALL